MFKKVLFLSLLLGGLSMSEVYKTRDEIPKEYKWNLKDIYNNWQEWETDYNKIETMSKELVGYKGQLSDRNKMLEFYKKQEEIDKLSYKLYMYPNLASDLNAHDKEATEHLQRAEYLFSKIGTDLSWVSSEVISIGEDKVLEWSKTPEFKDYKFGLENLFRMQKHVLNENESKLLSFYGQYMSVPENIYSEVTITDMKWPTVELSTGEKEQVTYGNYSKILTQNKNQEDRKKAFEGHYGAFAEKRNTIASIYNSILQRDIADSKAHNYDNFLQSFLSSKNIPNDVYLNLINSVKSNTEPLKRYMRLRKQLLGLKEYHNYDNLVGISSFDKEYNYEEAKQMTLESVKPLGEEYVSKMKTAISNGWLDVFETEGKRSGAYSTGVYGVHPYMLLNYNETMDAVFTLSHELGHTLHTLYSSENQPFSTHDYTIFVAEVASTFNERLLLDYMLEKAKTSEERIALLDQEIGNIVSTFYFQTLLADYEYQAHELASKGEPITADRLSEIMKNLFDTYYGDTVAKDEVLYNVWARIPHFYNSPFYVYQYATCFASSAKIYEDMIKQKDSKKREETRKKYIELLSSGGSDFPMEQLKRAGVDLSKKETIDAVGKQLDLLLDRLEKEIKNIKK